MVAVTRYQNHTLLSTIYTLTCYLVMFAQRQYLMGITKNFIFLTCGISGARFQETITCQKYTDLLPNGVCKPYLENFYISQSMQQAVNGDKELSDLSKVKIFLDKTVKTQETFLSIIKRFLKLMYLENCNNKTVILREINTIVFPIWKETSVCLEGIAWYGCFVTHRVCFRQNEKSLVYPPCFETCLHARSGPCKETVNAIQKVYEYHDTCHILRRPFLHKGILDCSDLPKVNRQRMLQCHLNLGKTKLSLHYNKSCYEDLGQNYVGWQNSTENGLRCSFWNDSLKIIYRTLNKNYCRNPEGIGERPWCYINNLGDWEYCGVTRCVQPSSSRDFYWFFMLLLVLLAILTGILVKLKRRYWSDTNLIKVYEEVRISQILETNLDSYTLSEGSI